MRSMPSSRRDELAVAACDYVLERGLIGLSLRPLAAALGTSDRMLLYHFGTREALIAEVLQRATERSVACLRALPIGADVAAGVQTLWQAHRSGPLDRCQRVYAQAAAQGLLGHDELSGPVASANAAWLSALADFLCQCGAEPQRAQRCGRFVDAAVMGLHLDLNIEDEVDLQEVVDDVATAAQALGSAR